MLQQSVTEANVVTAFSPGRAGASPISTMYDGKGNIGKANNRAAYSLGQLLVAGKLITREDLAFALEHQKNSKEPLGQILIRMGALDRKDLEKVLLMQGRPASS